MIAEPNVDNEPDNNSDNKKGAAVATATAATAGAATGGAAAAPAVVAGVQAIGFGASGIVSGSAAAGIMSAEAIAGGGAVAAGSTTATLQSIGATASLGALGAGATAALAITGAVAGAALLGGATFLTYKCIWDEPAGHHPKKVEGVVPGKWMVIKERGVANVCFYSFESLELAESFFHASWQSRVLLDEQGQELACAGWNQAALRTIQGIVRGQMEASSAQRE